MGVLKAFLLLFGVFRNKGETSKADGVFVSAARVQGPDRKMGPRLGRVRCGAG